MKKCLNKTKDPLQSSDALAVIGMTYRYEQEFEKAGNFLSRARKLMNTIKLDYKSAATYARICYEFGYYYRLLGRYNESLDSLNQGIKVSEHFDLRLTGATNLCFKGVVEFDLGRLTAARKTLNRSLETAQKNNSQLWIANANFHMGEIDVAEQHWEDAIRRFNTRLSFFRKIGDPIGIYWTTAYQAWVDFLQNRTLDNLISELEISIKEFHEIKYYEGIITLTNRGAWACYLQKDIVTANKWLLESKQVLKRTRFQRELLLYYVLSCQTNLLNNKALSHKYFEKAYELRAETGIRLFDKNLKTIVLGSLPNASI